MECNSTYTRIYVYVYHIIQWFSRTHLRRSPLQSLLERPPFSSSPQSVRAARTAARSRHSGPSCQAQMR